MRDQIVDFFRGLFDTGQWPPRWKCGEWSDFHGWMYILSELMIWTAYFLIPIIIIKYFAQKKATIKFRKVYVLFATFILLCGSTHLLDAVMFWVPMYRFNALVRLATGVVSLFTVYHLIEILPTVFRQKTNTELENEILRREEVERKLAEANLSLKAFASMASHDMQEPMRKISLMTSMLVKSNQNKLDDQSKEIGTKIINSSKRMQTMISDVLQLAQIADEVELTTVDTTQVFTLVKEDFEIKISEKNAIIEMGDLPKVIGNQNYLHQLFANLLSNAIKFCRTQPHIVVTGEVKNGTARIYINDNGIGMDPEQVSIIFQPFKRLNSKGEFEGTGIGLAIAKKIVDIHHGVIEVESEPGKGTTFIIQLQAA